MFISLSLGVNIELTQSNKVGHDICLTGALYFIDHAAGQICLRTVP